MAEVYSFLDPTENETFQAWQAYRARQQTFIQQQSQNGGEIARLAAEHAANNPQLQPGVALALAQAGILPSDPIAQEAYKVAPLAAQKKAKDKGWFHDFVNASIRGVVTTAAAPLDFSEGLFRSQAENIRERDFGDIINPVKNIKSAALQTDLGQIIDAGAHGREIDTGSGFFVNPESGIGKAQAAAAESAWSVNGKAATLGRVAANAVFESDTTAYHMMSGLIDAGTTLVADPTNIVGSVAAKAGRAARVFQPIDAGAVVGHRPAVASEIAQNWLDSHVGRTVTDHLTENSSPADIRRRLRNKVDLETARELADASTPEAVRQIIMDGAVTGRLREKPYVDGWRAFTPGQQMLRSQGLYAIKRRADSVRLFGSLPGDKFVLGDLDQSADTLKNTLKNANYKREEVDKWVNTLARTTDTESRRTVIMNAMNEMGDKIANYHTDVHKLSVGESVRDVNGQEYGKITRINKDLGSAEVSFFDIASNQFKNKTLMPLDSLVNQQADIQGQTVKELVKLYKKTTAGHQRYNIDNTGKEVGVEGLTNDGGHQVIVQPVLESQLANDILPALTRKDLVEIRRQTAGMGLDKLLTKPGYQIPASLLGKFANVWRDLTLIRGAYTIRVIGEEQLRMASRGLDSIASFHPLSAIAWAVGDDSKAAKWLSKPLPFLEDGLTGGARGKTDAWGKRWEDEAEAEGEFNRFAQAHQQRNADKRWAMTTTFDGYTVVGRGAEGFIPGHSMELRQLHKDPLASRIAGGWRHDDDVVMEGRLTGNDVEDAFEWYWNGAGREVRNRHAARGGNWAAIAEDPQLARNHVQGIKDMIDRVAVNDDDLMNLIARGKIGDKAATKRGVEQMLTAKAANGIGPEMVRTPLKDLAPEKVDDYRNAVDHAFDILITRPTNFLSRSPAFRQYYWQRMTELAPGLDAATQAKLLKNARTSNIGRRQMAALEKQVKQGSGDLGLKETDLLAKNFALDETKALLYDLGERGQFFDQARVVFAFGDAWKEATSTWGKTFRENPHQIANRLPQVIRGAHGADPDQDGRGFFYTDENGQEVFNFPLSAQAGRFATGVFGMMANPAQTITAATDGDDTTKAWNPVDMVSLKGQVSGLSMMGNGLPGFGPVMQVAFGEIVKAKPNFGPDWLRDEVLLPVGGPDYGNGFLEAFFPGWTKRVWTSFRSPEDNRVFGNTVGKVMDQKVASGQYDVSTQEGQDKLYKDSVNTARAFYRFRAAAQFVAPTAPAPEWLAKDVEGKVTTVSLMMQDYRTLKETLGYENADQAFLNKYGENAFMYMQPLSEGAFDPSTELHEWVKKNPEIAAQFPDSYGFFVGEGGAYSDNAYEQQVARGERPALRPKQVLELANDRVARMQYNQVRNMLSDTPNAQERAMLRDLQAGLVRKYPGYRPEGYQKKQTAILIDEVQTILDRDPKLANSGAGQAALRYLEFRSIAAEAVPGYKQSKAGAGVRQALRAAGQSLVADEPEFKRMFDLFDRELKDDELENT